MPWVLIVVMMQAFCTRASGLRAIAASFGEKLGTSCFSALGHALANEQIARYVKALADRLEDDWSGLGPQDLIAVDTTWITLPATQRHRGLKKVGSDGVGLGIMVALRLGSPSPSSFPLNLLQISNGASNDSHKVQSTALAGNGPTYVMDRGFYSMKAVDHFLSQNIHFIIRVRTSNFHYETLEAFSDTGKYYKGLRIIEDSLVILGSPNSRAPRSHVRLIIAERLSDGERLVLVTDHFSWGAKKLLDAYKMRWEIESFFLFWKEHLGLAHLYGFSRPAIETLVRIAFMAVALVLHAGACLGKVGTPAAKTLAQHLFRCLRQLRKALGMPPLWRPNTTRRWRKKKKKTKKNKGIRTLKQLANH